MMNSKIKTKVYYILLCLIILLVLSITIFYNSIVKKYVQNAIRGAITPLGDTESNVETSPLWNISANAFLKHITSGQDAKCKIPKLDPLDPSILPYIKKSQPFKCKNIQPNNLFYVDDYGFLVANFATNLERVAALHKADNFSCHATVIDKTVGDDRKINRSLSSKNVGTGANRIAVVTDAIEVQCNILRKVGGEDDNQTEKLEEHRIYHNVFGNPRNLSRKIIPTDDKYFSVHLMITDSTSMSMFERTLNKTFHFLVNKLNMYRFRGFNKVGTNTFPNMVAMLTGKRAYNGDRDQPRQFKGKYSTMFFDDWNYIWKDFALKGYATSFNEDVPEWGAFHYLSRGFKLQPVDHYYFPFWWAMKEARTESDSKYCFRNKPLAHRQLDVFKREVKKYKNRRHFGYLFQGQLSHDSISDLAKYDDYYFDYFSRFSKEGYFDDKIIFVLSDHGHRFSAIRSTLVGLLEERLPMLGIIVPSRFCKLYAQICKNLKHNQDKLVTHFDLHQTLLDIAEANYAAKQRDEFKRNLSLLYPIPSNRSCESAGIPKFFCSCQNSKTLNVTTDAVLNAGMYATSNINKMLEVHGSKCALLRFRKVIRAEKLHTKHDSENSDNETVNANRFTNGIHDIRLAFDVMPSNAIFETLVQFDADKRKYRIEGSTSRLNKYGSQSHCIRDRALEQFCFCKNLR